MISLTSTSLPRNTASTRPSPGLAHASTRGSFEFFSLFLVVLRVNRQPWGRRLQYRHRCCPGSSSVSCFDRTDSSYALPRRQSKLARLLSAGTARNSQERVFLGCRRLVYRVCSLLFVLFLPQIASFHSYFCIFQPAYFIFPFPLPLPSVNPVSRVSRSSESRLVFSRTSIPSIYCALVRNTNTGNMAVV